MWSFQTINTNVVIQTQIFFLRHEDGTVIIQDRRDNIWYCNRGKLWFYFFINVNYVEIIYFSLTKTVRVLKGALTQSVLLP